MAKMSAGTSWAEGLRSRVSRRRTGGGWTGQKRAPSCRPSRTVRVVDGVAVSGSLLSHVDATAPAETTSWRHSRALPVFTPAGSTGPSCLSKHTLRISMRHLPIETFRFPQIQGQKLRTFGRVDSCRASARAFAAANPRTYPAGASLLAFQLWFSQRSRGRSPSKTISGLHSVLSSVVKGRRGVCNAVRAAVRSDTLQRTCCTTRPSVCYLQIFSKEH